MKRVLYFKLLLAVCLFLSCKSNTIQPYMQGVWVKKDYVETVAKTRSPYASRNHQSGVTSIYIEIANSKTDSTYAGYSFDNHEGSGFTLYAKPGQKPASFRTNLPDYLGVKSNYYELGYHVNNHDTTLVLYHYTKGNLIMDSTEYTKVANKASDNTDASWGVQYITNKKVMAGAYKLTGARGAASVIKFDNNGKVSGFSNYKNYEITTDFVSGPENNLDQVGFYATDIEEAEWYTYKFNADTLNLYETRDNADSTLLVPDKLKYKLIKQN